GGTLSETEPSRRRAQRDATREPNPRTWRRATRYADRTPGTWRRAARSRGGTVGQPGAGAGPGDRDPPGRAPSAPAAGAAEQEGRRGRAGRRRAQHAPSEPAHPRAGPGEQFQLLEGHAAFGADH